MVVQEAEALCDRLGIFVDGQLVCIGNPKEITSRYAGFLVFSISVSMDQEQVRKAESFRNFGEDGERVVDCFLPMHGRGSW